LSEKCCARHTPQVRYFQTFHIGGSGIFLAEETVCNVAARENQTKHSEHMFLSAVKRLFLWTYARNTWQYDVLCALILAFIFLTPKSWFDNGELRSSQEHQSPLASTVLVALPENGDTELSAAEVERRVRVITNRPEIRVANIRKRLDGQGKIVAYEVDIR
jgi:hypothetical protein